MAGENRTDYISQAWNAYKGAVKSPLLSSLLIGGGIYGLGRLAWNPIVETSRSIFRYPGRALSGMSDQEWDEAMDEIKTDSSYRKWLPAAFAALASVGALGFSYDHGKKYNGLLSYNAERTPPGTAGGKDKSIFRDSYYGTPVPKESGMDKKQSKQAGLSYSYEGPMDDIDYYQAINSRDAMSLFTNDPFLQNKQYAKNMGTSIIADAAIRTGNNTPTLGNVFDSAFNKIENKLTFEGLASVGVKTVVANGAARLFTNAVGSMVGLPKETQNKLIDAGTWAGAITSIFE